MTKEDQDMQMCIRFDWLYGSSFIVTKVANARSFERKIGWDEVLPVEREHKYRLWENTMHLMSKCTIPRRFFAENYDDFTLHIFTDASAYAYATCVFL
ncbi:integrase catalytic domain-containing protein [Trichonephila clavipes]|nr:integrase catalytic domain-containing protein [Trichonephila clavipes]